MGYSDLWGHVKGQKEQFNWDLNIVFSSAGSMPWDLSTFLKN